MSLGHRETAVALGPHARVAAVLCEPAGGDARGVACLLLNTGVGERIGLQRTNVKVARQLAAQGITSLRLDLSGLGDSPAATDGLHFKDQAMADLRTALDWLQQQRGIDRGLVFGVCSGALNGYLLAQSDRRVVGLALFDLFTEVSVMGRLRLHLADLWGSPLAEWPALIRSKLALRRARQDAAPDMFDSGSTPVVPTREQAAATLHALAARGVDVYMMYSHMCATVCEVPRSGQPFAPTVRCERMDDVDHVITPLAAQHRVLDAVTQWACGVAARHPKAPT